MTMVASSRHAHGHTERDFNELVAAGVNPADTQPRENAVQCTFCRNRTWHLSGRCDWHYEPPRATRRKEAAS